MDAIWDALIAHLGAREDYFRLFDRHRMRPDAWLKVEALAAVGLQVRQARVDRQGCDLWLGTGETEIWLATKGLLTSYAGAGREARPTIAAMEEVSRELDKLRGLATLAGGTPAMLLAAFAFGPEPRERNEWQGQMLRFEAKGFAPVRRHVFDLRADRECRIYLIA